VTQESGALLISNVQSTTSEVFQGSGAIDSRELAWFAVQTKPRHEKKAATELLQKGVITFLPQFSEKRQWSDRTQLVELPLFPQYMFVRVANVLDSRASVLRTTGITNFVGVRGIGIPIPDEQIERVQAVLAQRVSVKPHSFINVGGRVRIVGGALDGLQGVLSAVNGDQSLMISVDLIKRSLAIRLEGFAIEPV
jgi:transcription antitermination factor NusG